MQTWRRQPVLTAAESRALDSAAEIAGLPRETMMARAGAAVVDAIVARWAPCETLVVCGPGDNGGDGWVAARALAERGWPVRVATVMGATPSAAARDAAKAWEGPRSGLDPARVAGAGLIVDAVFGSGLSRGLDRNVAVMLRAAEATEAPLVAIDLPSGLHADTAAILGFAPRATLTVALATLKPAHLLEAGRAKCGETCVVDIGLPTPAHFSLELNAPGMWGGRLPWPGVAAHKTQRGRLVVVGGGASMTGAARLTARAGLRIGAGLVTLLCPSDALLVNAAALEAVMVRPFDSEAELAALAANADTAVIGPGAGVDEATADNLLTLARTGAALVVDADALTVFKDDPQELFCVLDRDDVLTPHVGEFDRVFPGLLERSPDRIAAARAAAAQAGAVVVLKGPDTVIGAPDGRAAVNANAAPWLATAGSGDVLAGLVGGLLAQGMESYEAACAAVWMHGEIGSEFGPGLVAEDLPDRIPALLRRLHGARGKLDRGRTSP